MYPKKKGQEMRQKIVREGNAFYEIDDECMRKKEEQKKKKEFQPKDSTSSKKNIKKAPANRRGNIFSRGSIRIRCRSRFHFHSRTGEAVRSGYSSCRRQDRFHSRFHFHCHSSKAEG